MVPRNLCRQSLVISFFLLVFLGFFWLKDKHGEFLRVSTVSAQQNTFYSGHYDFFSQSKM